MGNTRLLKTLQRNGMSQRRASQALDISQNLINRVVKHGATPGLRTAAKIVHGFDGEISYDDLLSNEDRRAMRKLKGVLVGGGTQPKPRASKDTA